MCLYGTLKYVDIINSRQNEKRVVVDACIADEIQYLNKMGIITLGCCCNHGISGQITEWENNLGKWKQRSEPPNALIDEKSISFAKGLGYRPIPYMYADEESDGVWKIYLKTGCITMAECREWHEQNNLSFEKDLGVVGENIERG